jgi:hypothetical protein
MKVERCALFAVALLAIAANAAAAARNCRDVLISTPAKRYSCTGAYLYTETGPPYTVTGTAGFEAEFVEASPPDPAVFLLRAANGHEMRCVCDSSGTTERPRFFSEMSFTCQDARFLARGEVTGRNGDRIRSFAIDEIKLQSDGGSEINIGGCVRIR